MITRWIRQLSSQILKVWARAVGPRLLPLLVTIEVVGLVLASLGLWVFAELADQVLEQATRGVDTAILLFLRQLHTPLLDQLMIGITTLGQPTLFVPVSLILCGVLALQRQWFKGIVFVSAALGAAGLNVLLKDGFGRSRPALWDRGVDVQYSSFPSGHAMVSLVIYKFGRLSAGPRSRYRSDLILALTVLLIGLIGLSRLYLGATGLPM